MTKFGKDLIQAMNEALAHARGDEVGIIEHRVQIDAIDVKNSRKALRLTQEQMALLLGVSTSGYRKWEQGQRQPNGAARTLLKVMAREPEAVLRAVEYN